MTALIKTNEKAVFWTLAFMLILFVGIYVFSLNIVMQNVVERGRAEGRIGALASSIVELEARYLKQKNQISLDLAYSLGYREATKTTFVPRKSVSAAGPLGSAE